MRKNTRIMPAYREGEREQLDRHWRGLFLDTLAETSNVSEAARRAGINPSRAYKVRREEAGFRVKWAAALAEGYAHLEMETLYRLRMGTEAGKDERKFDLANALRLLALHRQSVAQTAAQESDDAEEAILQILHSRIEAARAREARRLAAAESAPCNDD